MNRAVINVRIDADLKKRSKAVLDRAGISMSDAIRIFLAQVELQGGLPFEAKIPNAATRAAIRELERGGGRRMSLEEWIADTLEEPHTRPNNSGKKTRKGRAESDKKALVSRKR